MNISLKRLSHIALLAAVLIHMQASRLHGSQNRSICVGTFAKYYKLDSDYFGMGEAVGMNVSFKYEISFNVFFENSIGTFFSDTEDISIQGINYQLNIMALIPVLIPYRPLARVGVGFISSNPLTATPTDTYRPTQTTFYFIGGGGITRPLRGNFLLEASLDFWFAPYLYRIYTFDREQVMIKEKQFTHTSFTLGLSYSF